MSFRTVTVEHTDWEELHVVHIKCPYCNKRIQIVRPDFYNDKEKCKCDECFNTFYLFTKNHKYYGE